MGSININWDNSVMPLDFNDVVIISDSQNTSDVEDWIGDRLYREKNLTIQETSELRSHSIAPSSSGDESYYQTSHIPSKHLKMLQ